ncbi:MAG: chromosome segregation protein SMC [Planctomycetota bacterium]
MRLKRLELFGFKSFADRTTLSFDPSLVGVVGPNGCGKSNVVDAVRWVLGEQRAKSMRGGEMTDVIFKGAASRPGMSVAEATLIFDNASGELEGFGTRMLGSEVAVTRRVYKSGEGEYLIDGDRVRLKDVREMLYGTGLGSRGYAVLEQGKIDAVLSANAQERRAIFEEAAGVSRYRQRKKETESRLKRVEADVERVDDVVGELERRERSLKIQAGKAQRFVETRDAWHVDGLRLAQHQAFFGLGKMRSVGDELSSIESTAEEHRELRSAVEQDVDVREREQQTLSSELERTNASANELNEALRVVDERRAELEARMQGWAEAIAEEEARTESATTRLVERRAEAEALEVEVAAFDAEARAAAAELERTKERLVQLRGEEEGARTSTSRQNQLVLGLYDQKSQLAGRVEHLEGEIEPVRERLARAAERRSEAEAALALARTEAEQLAGEAEAARARLARLEGEHGAGRGDLAALDENMSQLERRRSELEMARVRLASHVEALLDREREREDLEAGAQRLLEGLEAGSGPELVGTIAGLFADHVTTNTEHSRALDAALGERSRALVATSPEDAVTIVRWLKETKHGRVRLVLADGAVGAPRAREAALAERPEVLGFLRDHAAVEAGFEDVAEALFGDVVLARDLDAALALGRAFPALRFATLDGDLVDRRGLVGGHSELAQGAIGRRAVAAELEAEREVKSAELDAIGQQHAALAQQRHAAREHLDQLDLEMGEAREARGQAQVAAETAGRRVEELTESSHIFTRELATVEAEREKNQRDLAEARERLLAAEAKHTEETAVLADLTARLEAIRQDAVAVGQDENAARVTAGALRERLGAGQRRRSDLARAIDEAQAEVARGQKQAVELRERVTEAQAKSVELTERRADVLARRDVVTEQLGQLREREREGRTVVEELRRRKEATTTAIERLFASVSEKRLEQQRLELGLEELARRAEEDFGMTAEMLVDDFEPEAELEPCSDELAELEARVTGLKREIDKLGPVNLEAVVELDEVLERLGFLRAQRADLAEAKRSLEHTLDRLNEESERRFLETFEEVRANFQVLFRQLFGGGKADVQLAEGEPILEAGIDIFARPPGREMLPITLLSGGQRSLTALAMLFAIFQAKPSPFCVLDEVDAALDDANIGRFLGMIGNFRKDTQFIIVTHNKATMAASDMLYGVTMPSQGVSKVVSVELRDVEDFVPDTVGSYDEPVVELTPHSPDEPAPASVLVEGAGERT